MAKPVRVVANVKDDQVGELLMYALKEELRKSSGAILVEKPEAWQISLICDDPDVPRKTHNTRTMCSVAIVFEGNGGMRGLMESHFLTSCGYENVDRCAKRIAAALDAVESNGIGTRPKPRE